MVVVNAKDTLEEVCCRHPEGEPLIPSVDKAGHATMLQMSTLQGATVELKSSVFVVVVVITVDAANDAMVGALERYRLIKLVHIAMPMTFPF